MPVSFLKFKDRAKSSKGFWIKLVENSKLILYTPIFDSYKVTKWLQTQ